MMSAWVYFLLGFVIGFVIGLWAYGTLAVCVLRDIAKPKGGG